MSFPCDYCGKTATHTICSSITIDGKLIEEMVYRACEACFQEWCKSARDNRRFDSAAWKELELAL
jgi:hypothetical protein